MGSLTGAASKSETIAGTIATKGVTPKSLTAVGLSAVSVKGYGATGLDVADDTSAIQTALTAAGSHASRTCYIPAGTYRISADLIPAANTTIVGAGVGSTTLKITGTSRAFAIANIPGVTIRDLTIDCNKANTTDNGTTTQHGIHLTANNTTGCPRTRLERVKIINAWDRGVNAQATTLDTHPLEVDLIDCEISGCTSQGAFIEKSTRTRVKDGNYHDNLYGLQVVGGRDPILDGVRVYDNTDHGLVTNTAVVNPTITKCRAWGNGSTNDWGMVVGINGTQFNVSDNWCWDNAGGMTIDVADTVTNPVQGDGVIQGNICVDNTIADGIHVNQADGVSITGNVTARNEQDGISIYGRNAMVSGNVSHHNGRDGINYEEDLTSPLASCGPHIHGPNICYDNNQNAGTWKDVYSAQLTNGPVLFTNRGECLPLDVPSGEYVQLNPSPMTTSVMNDGQAYLLPFDLLEPQSFDQLLFEVVTTAGGTGSVCRGNLYWDDGTGRRPGKLRESLGTVGTTTTGVKSFTISSTSFSIGRWWAEIVPQGTPSPNPTLRVVTCPFIRVSTPGLATLAQEFLMATGITGAPADPHGTVNSNNSLAIAMALRAA